MIQFNKAPGQRILELGCGANRNAASDVAVDVRPGPGVDFAVNLAEPGWPIGSDEFDAVLSIFCLEHIPYPAVPTFLAEALRVLRPGGRAIILIPNTEAQLKWILAHPDGWDGKGLFASASCKLFGDQEHGKRLGAEDAGVDSHKAYFNPAIALELFNAAGFEGVITAPFGERATDMIVEARKPIPSKTEQVRKVVDDINQILVKATGSEEIKIDDWQAEPIKAEPAKPATPYEPAKLFNRQYFDFGGPGYPHGYMDFPQNELIARHVLARKPQSVLELGCGRGYLTKRLQDAGIAARGFDVARHCYLTRVCTAIHTHDLCLTPWPAASFDNEWPKAELNVFEGGFDLCLSVNFFEHIPEDRLPQVFAEMQRVTKRGLHGIAFVGNGHDTTQCFPAGTMIATPEGEKPIESLRPGDLVFGASEAGCSDVALVQKTFCNRSAVLIHLILDNGVCLAATEEHPIKVVGKGWVRITDILPDDEVYYAGNPDQRTDSLCSEQLSENVVPRNGRDFRDIMGGTSANSFQETEAEKGTTWSDALAAPGEKIASGEVCLHVKAGTSSITSTQKLVQHHKSCSQNGIDSGCSRREAGSVDFIASHSSGSRLHCGFGRRGGVDIHTANCGGGGDGCYGLQCGSADDRIRAEEVWGNDLHKESRDSGNGTTFKSSLPGLSCSKHSGIPSTADAQSYPPVFDNQKDGIGSSATLLGIAISQAKECPDFRSREGFVFGVAKVVSTKRNSGVDIPVFNLETSTENYVANGVLVHNCTLKPRAWWVERLPAGHEVVDVNELRAGKLPNEYYRSAGDLVKLNIGCHMTMFHRGWTNVDSIDVSQFAKTNGFTFQHRDVRHGLIQKTGLVDAVILHHVFEHLPAQDGLALLREIRRVLKPETGCLRIAVPNAAEVVRRYTDKSLGWFDEMNGGCAAANTHAQKMHAMLYEGHAAVYDEESLLAALEAAGFVAKPSRFRQMAFDRSGFKVILQETVELDYGGLSLFVDAVPAVG